VLYSNTLEIVVARKEEQKPLNFSDNSVAFCNFCVHFFLFLLFCLFFFKEENELCYIYFII